MLRVLAALALTLAASTAAATERLPEEELGEMAAGRLRLEALRADADDGAYGGVLARAEQDLACWTAGIEAGDVAPAEACHADFKAAMSEAEQLAATARGPLVAEH